MKAFAYTDNCPFINFPDDHKIYQSVSPSQAVQLLINHKIWFTSKMWSVARRSAWRFTSTVSPSFMLFSRQMIICVSSFADRSAVNGLFWNCVTRRLTSCRANNWQPSGIIFFLRWKCLPHMSYSTIPGFFQAGMVTSSFVYFHRVQVLVTFLCRARSVNISDERRASTRCALFCFRSRAKYRKCPILLCRSLTSTKAKVRRR